ncbi:MAG TPA: alanyl-tRNA editing protein [Desulfomonilia bacterium]|nr:alanyl-tRNA editing protein [Desulfomonilia bacterium]
MPAEKIFWEDPYLVELQAEVTSVAGDIITLDRTIFYAASGGQESDTGTIGGLKVIAAEKKGMEIYYTLQGPHDLQQGSEVLVKIDWPRRYRLMRLHFAAEIMLELVYQHFHRPVKIGANISEDKARLDFLWEGRISDTFPVLLEHAERIIGADLPIRSEYTDHLQEKRCWEIEGFARVSCGGTHIRRTGEVGRIRLKRNNIGKGKDRMEIYLVGEEMR